MSEPLLPPVLHVLRGAITEVEARFAALSAENRRLNDECERLGKANSDLLDEIEALKNPNVGQPADKE